MTKKTEPEKRHHPGLQVVAQVHAFFIDHLRGIHSAHPGISFEEAIILLECELMELRALEGVTKEVVRTNMSVRPLAKF